MGSFAGSLADSMPFKFLPVHQYKEGNGSSKVYRKLKREELLGWLNRLNASLKSTETRDKR